MIYFKLTTFAGALLFLYMTPNSTYAQTIQCYLGEGQKEQVISLANEKNEGYGGNNEVSNASLRELKDVVKDIIVKGRVADSTGKPIEGVSVHVKGTDAGTSTNINGEYTINAPRNGTLVFSSIGFATQEISINGQNIVNVRLLEKSKALNEVVVTGYSNQRKKDITGSVAVVDVNALKSIPTGSVEQALQGQAAGVTVISSGAPGGRNDIFIRGVTSFGNSQPLIIVDGVQGSLTDLNINDIASMQVLKDAGAAAIYGVRGFNGVIVITTKKGKSGQSTISLDSY